MSRIEDPFLDFWLLWRPRGVRRGMWSLLSHDRFSGTGAERRATLWGGMSTACLASSAPRSISMAAPSHGRAPAAPSWRRPIVKKVQLEGYIHRNC